MVFALCRYVEDKWLGDYQILLGMPPPNEYVPYSCCYADRVVVGIPHHYTNCIPEVTVGWMILLVVAGFICESHPYIWIFCCTLKSQHWHSSQYSNRQSEQQRETQNGAQS
jgi:hypothetical protein